MLYILDRVLLAAVVLCTFLSVALTIHDKRVSRIRGHWRVPERTLLLLALFGFALPEFFTMLLIHHKTKHKKFMLGLPAFMLVHIAVVVAAGLLLK